MKNKETEFDTEQAMHELAVSVLSEVVLEDADIEEKVRSVVRGFVEEEMADGLEEAVKEEIGDRAKDLDTDDVRSEAVKAAVEKLLEKMHDEAVTA